MGDDVQFRKARPGDAGTMLSVKRAAILGIEDDRYDEDQLAAWAPDGGNLGAFEASPSADQYEIRVATIDDTVVGYGVLHLPEERLDALFVSPFYAGAGIATTLLKQLETAAQFAGIERIELTSSLTAVGFYERHGYERTGTTDREIEGVTVPFVAMARRLAPEDPQNDG
ncbi:GNAT family N-acetyltransferase [Halomicroarcula sp. GCM10025709]|uniref:GNAT family N-acetyltransferase n=1 Tax=Haloarcula TaxID=2237 RepID=UPI0024C21251|nr:GNAT family N-acetyltransferase [Halomicroarcula sp. YJ-61-S]